MLYPNDEPDIEKRLRLAQQYFFVSCSLRDMVRILDMIGVPIERFAEEFAVQRNDSRSAASATADQ